MIRKVGVFALVVGFLFLSVASFAQDRGRPAKSLEDLNTADIANDSIVVLSQQDTSLPGYVHEQYVFVHEACPGGAQIVDYFGPPIDPKDRYLHWLERTACAQREQREMNDRD